MPGARRVRIVVIMLTAPRMVPRPEMTRPITHMLPPTPGECSALASGVYPVQPKSAAPCGVRKPAVAMVPPNRYSQYAKLFSRGKATSGAPIWMRHHVVGEREHDGRREEQQHDRAVHGEQLVELLRRHDLQPGLGQLGPHDQGHHATDHEEHERGDHVHDPDLLRVRGPQQPCDGRPLDRFADRPGPGHDRLGCDGGHEWPPVLGCPARHALSLRAVIRKEDSPRQVGAPRGVSGRGSQRAWQRRVRSPGVAHSGPRSSR